jgi:hypothetical protein
VARIDPNWEQVKAEWEKLKVLGRAFVGAILTLLGSRSTPHDKKAQKYIEAFQKFREECRRNQHRRAASGPPAFPAASARALPSLGKPAGESLLIDGQRP